MISLVQNQLHTYRENGYLLIREAFDCTRIESLVGAIDNLIDRALDNRVELDWIDRNLRLPRRMSHLLHPDKYHPTFGSWIDEDLAPQLSALVPGDLRHSLFGMLTSGANQPYCQKWHRDLVKPGTSDETSILQRHKETFVQFNAPLTPSDRFLQIVPGSHLRASTTQEIAVSQNQDGNMPGIHIVELEPGDIVYYNANLWHRGWNPTGQTRLTFHCAFWNANFPVMEHEFGQREQLTQKGHLEQLPPTTKRYIENYLEVYPENAPPSLYDL